MNCKLVVRRIGNSHLQCMPVRRSYPRATPDGPVTDGLPIPKESVVRARVIMVLASAVLAGSILANDAQARGGAGHGGGGEVRLGGFGQARIGGLGGNHMAGLRRGRFAAFAAPAFGQTETLNGYASGYAPAPASGLVSDQRVGGPAPETVTGPGLNIVGPDGVSTRTVRAVPCSTAAQETDGTTTCVGLQ
jgi:hypothetical protein